jgi:hypothetical protein
MIRSLCKKFKCFVMIKKYDACSSEVYHLDPVDVMKLSDHPLYEKENKEVVIFLGNEKEKIPDKLFSGRDLVKQALQEKTPYIPVRFVFLKRAKGIKGFVLHFIKPFRRKLIAKGMGLYHIRAQELQEKGLVRKIRTRQNAYDLKNKKWAIPPEERQKRWNDLYASLQKTGYDDHYPLEVMLCRSLGAKDSLQQGHHRMGILNELHIERVAVEFSAAGAAPLFIRSFFQSKK